MKTNKGKILELYREYLTNPSTNKTKELRICTELRRELGKAGDELEVLIIGIELANKL